MHFGDDGIPDGIVWMPLSMRKLLLRFRDILSLDAQKRQFNNMCWPYIGPVVKTNENTIRCVAESAVIAENLEMYQWVIESMNEISRYTSPFFQTIIPDIPPFKTSVHVNKKIKRNIYRGRIYTKHLIIQIPYHFETNVL